MVRHLVHVCRVAASWSSVFLKLCTCEVDSGCSKNWIIVFFASHIHGLRRSHHIIYVCVVLIVMCYWVHPVTTSWCSRGQHQESLVCLRISYVRMYALANQVQQTDRLANIHPIPNLGQERLMWLMVREVWSHCNNTATAPRPFTKGHSQYTCLFLFAICLGFV